MGMNVFFACFKSFDPSIVWEGNTYDNSEISCKIEKLMSITLICKQARQN